MSRLKSAKDAMYVLTSEINEYNQEGEYFEAVFKSKPTINELSTVFFNKKTEELTEDQTVFLTHVFNGGGRRGYEDLWYNLRPVNSKGMLSDKTQIL